MPLLSTVPDEVDFRAYGGDTLTFAVTAPSSLVNGREWSGHIRTSRTDATASAEFTITPPAVADGPAYVTLPAAESERLLSGVAAVREKRGPGLYVWVLRYEGVYDVQVAAPGGLDPVTTLVQGDFTLELDVTREDG